MSYLIIHVLFNFYFRQIKIKNPFISAAEFFTPTATDHSIFNMIWPVPFQESKPIRKEFRGAIIPKTYTLHGSREQAARRRDAGRRGRTDPTRKTEPAKRSNLYQLALSYGRTNDYPNFNFQ